MVVQTFNPNTEKQRQADLFEFQGYTVRLSTNERVWVSRCLGSGGKGLDRMGGIPVVPAVQQSKANGQPAKPYLKTNTKAISVTL